MEPITDNEKNGANARRKCVYGGLRTLVRRKQADFKQAKSSAPAEIGQNQLARALTVPHLIAIGINLFVCLISFFPSISCVLVLLFMGHSRSPGSICTSVVLISGYARYFNGSAYDITEQNFSVCVNSILVLIFLVFLFCFSWHILCPGCICIALVLIRAYTRYFNGSVYEINGLNFSLSVKKISILVLT